MTLTWIFKKMMLIYVNLSCIKFYSLKVTDIILNVIPKNDSSVKISIA